MREASMSRIVAGLAMLAFSSSIGAIAADETPAPRSAALASALNGLMSTAGVDAMAAADPEHPDRFVAALAVPGVQLLVVDAKSPAPAVVTQRIAARQFRDVYTELQRQEARQDRVFVYDIGADGLSSKGGDVLYASGEVQTIFNGEPAAQKLTESTYRQRLAESDERYSRMLSLLIDALKRPPSQ
jgi:hypothetical protein